MNRGDVILFRFPHPSGEVRANRYDAVVWLIEQLDERA
jgi:hypothetical protein